MNRNTSSIITIPFQYREDYHAVQHRERCRIDVEWSIEKPQKPAHQVNRHGDNADEHHVKRLPGCSKPVQNTDHCEIAKCGEEKVNRTIQIAAQLLEKSCHHHEEKRGSPGSGDYRGNQEGVHCLLGPPFYFRVTGFTTRFNTRPTGVACLAWFSLVHFIILIC